MDDFARCIKEGRPTPVSGEEGRKDIRILAAVYKAMETGERVILEPPAAVSNSNTKNE
jgi:predicted dehydrogenase